MVEPCFQRRGLKGSRRGAQRKDLCVLCENLRALCVEILLQTMGKNFVDSGFFNQLSELAEKRG